MSSEAAHESERIRDEAEYLCLGLQFTGLSSVFMILKDRGVCKRPRQCSEPLCPLS